MKSIVIKTTLFLSLLGSMVACSRSSQQQTEKHSKEYTSAYICPMHCQGSGSDTAGTCPTCGMDYVQNNKK